MNDLHNATNAMLLNQIFVHRLVNNFGQREQSRGVRAALFILFMHVPTPVNK